MVCIRVVRGRDKNNDIMGPIQGWKIRKYTNAHHRLFK